MQKLLPMFCALMILSGCNAVEAFKSDIGEVGQAATDSRHMETMGIKVPDAYVGQRPTVLKPPGMQNQPLTKETPAPVVVQSSPSSANWNDIGTYNGMLPAATNADQTSFDDLAPVETWQPTMQAQATAAQPVLMVAPPVSFGDSVSVFPLDGGDSMPYMMPSYSQPAYQQASVTYPLSFSDQAYGRILQKIYFGHGSAAVPAADKRELKRTAKGLQNQASSVTVVGHASKRVDGVEDPIRKKMINFEMAQKRANAVTNELQRAGLDPNWVRTVSKGDDEPSIDTGSKSQEEADRRVELYVAGQ